MTEYTLIMDDDGSVAETDLGTSWDRAAVRSKCAVWVTGGDWGDDDDVTVDVMWQVIDDDGEVCGTGTVTVVLDAERAVVGVYDWAN